MRSVRRSQTPTDTTKGVETMQTKRKTHTSSEVKKRYNDKTYTRFQISLRKDEDAELIAYIEQAKQNGESVTEAIRKLYKKNK